MADIGKLALTIGANAAPLDAVLSKAGDTIKRFGFTAATALRGAFSFGGLGASADALGKALERAVANPLSAISKALAVTGEGLSRIPVVGGLLALPFDAAAGAAGLFADAIDRSQEQLGALQKISRTAGISIEDAQVFTFLAGSVGGLRQDFDKTLPLLTKFQSTLGLAAAQGREADNGFNRLGLSAREMLGRTPLENALAVGEALKGLNNQALAGSLAGRIFGDELGPRLVPNLLKGAAGIEALREKLAAFGLTATTGQAASFKALNERANEFRLLREGFFNQLSAASLPVLAELMDSLPRITGGFGGLAESVVGFGRTATVSVARFLDTLGDKGAWASIEALASSAFDLIEDRARLAGAAFLDAITPRKLKDFPSNILDSSFDAGEEDPRAVAARERRRLREVEAARRGPPGLFPAFLPGTNFGIDPTALGGGLGAVGEGLFGKGGPGPLERAAIDFADRVEARLRKVPAALGDGLASAFSAAEQRLRTLGEAGLSPLEKFKRSAAEISGLANTLLPGDTLPIAGTRGLQLPPSGVTLGDLNPGVGGRLMFSAFEALRSAVGQPARTQAAMEAGGAEAARAITAFGEASKVTNVQERMAQIMAEAKELERRQVEQGEQFLRLQQQIADNLRPRGM